MAPPKPSANVFDELTAAVPPGALQHVLSYFGIHESYSDDGGKKWTIAIARDASKSFQQEAVFEASTRSWTLRDRYLAINIPSPSLKLPSVEVNKTSTAAPRHTDDDASLPVMFDTPNWIDAFPKNTHSDFIKSVDWSSTPIGTMDTWPTSLRLYTNMILSQQTPAAVYWGSEYISIYNEGLVPLIGKTHPQFMGAAFMDVWGELRSSFEAIFTQIKTTGMGIDLSDYNLFLHRNNYTEETWWRGNLFPLSQENGTIGGYCFMWNEVTRQVLSDRRTKLLNDMGRFDYNTDNVWKHIRKTLRCNPRDIAMACLYSYDDVTPSGDRILKKEATIGVGTDHRAAPEELNLDKSQDGFAPALREALKSPDGWISINKDTANFTPTVLDGIDWQGYGEHSQELVIMPLQVVNDHLKGFVILGLNPRRAFDADHRQFICDMQRQLITIMTSITTQEQAKQRESKLMTDLAESERRIRHLAELAPMGLFDLAKDGRMAWANGHYFSIMGIDRPKNIADTPWTENVDPDELPRVAELFNAGISSDAELAGTVRLKRKWQPPLTEGDDDKDRSANVHVYFQALSYKEHGEVVSIMGSVTDVSRFVWAESVQARMAETAQRARQRQEEFIDIVSHELRNPLSAVTQCADGIIQSLREFRQGSTRQEMEAAIDSCVDAADSILLCAAHQKRIVDDVLTLSKLDSELITLAPTKFQPFAIQKEAMQMFQSEFLANKINVTVYSEDDDQVCPTEAMICDPARVSQVLVNLITNAIKFQKPDGYHRISIRYGVRRKRPQESQFGKRFQWSHSSNCKYADTIENPEYGQGDIVYLYFAVRDNGQGLPREKAIQIFDKFIQAARRTHVKYGGSGLGLYISRQLTEMQGGHIGIESEDGVGSTFAFYVKARLANQPDPSLSTRRSSSLTNRPVDSPPGDKSLPTTFEILLVEDNLVNQKVLAKQLRKAGCTVHVANHGGEAVDLMLSSHGHAIEYGTTIPEPFLPISSASPDPESATPDTHIQPRKLDCILMDWEMPVLDGLAATERIRNLEKSGLLKQKQIILGVTANARAEQIDMAMAAGMDAVVTKPFRVSELTKKIGELIVGR